MMRCVKSLLAAVMLLLANGNARAEDASEQALREELAQVPHKILFERYIDSNWELFLMNADGSGQLNLTQTPGQHELYPQAAPDGSKVCYLLDAEVDGETTRSVYVMNADGTGRKLVAEKARQPCWHPGSTKIAFVKQEFDRFHIADYASKGLYVYDLATGETVRHPNDAIEHLYTPNWPPDGAWFVSTVHAGMGYGHGILAIEAQGDKVYNLGIPGCRPSVSPDGTQITWSPDDHTIGVASVDFGGERPRVSDVRKLAEDATLHYYHPDFSPCGRYITWSIGPGGRQRAAGPGTHTQVAEMIGVVGPWDIYVKRADGTGPALQLTTDAALSNKESEWLPVPTKDN